MVHDQIRALFEALIARNVKEGRPHSRDRQIFITVLGDTPQTRARFLLFLHDVGTCPPEVIAWCQQELNR